MRDLPKKDRKKFLKEEAARFEQCRTELGLLQKEVADKIGYNHASISMIEKGKAFAGNRMLKLLEKEVGIRADYILTGQLPKFIPGTKPTKRDGRLSPPLDEVKDTKINMHHPLTQGNSDLISSLKDDIISSLKREVEMLREKVKELEAKKNG